MLIAKPSDKGHDGHQGQEKGARPGDAHDNVVQIGGGLFARTYAGDETALPLQHAGQVLLLENNGGIEERRSPPPAGSRAPSKSAPRAGAVLELNTLTIWLAKLVPVVVPPNQLAMMPGKVTMAMAKMSGIMPAVLTRMGI